jgi:rare lipoprotein A
MRLKKNVFFLFLCLLHSSFLYGQISALGSESSGVASYYGAKFYGRKTASGEILKKGGLTCAHPKLPFGTMLEVTNLANNQSCVVRVNDRGPFRKNRILDLSHDAAEQLSMFQSGIAKVRVMVVGENGTVIITRPQGNIIENPISLMQPAQTKEESIRPLILVKKKVINEKKPKKKK